MRLSAHSLPIAGFQTPCLIKPENLDSYTQVPILLLTNDLLAIVVQGGVNFNTGYRYDIGDVLDLKIDRGDYEMFVDFYGEVTMKQVPDP